MQGCVNHYWQLPKNPSYRAFCFLGFIYSASIISLAYGLEYAYQLEPCSLCLLQRLVMAITGILFLLGAIAILSNIWAYILTGLLFIINSCGIFLAGRQVWLQSLPAELVPSCTAGIIRLIEVHPIFKALRMVINSGECAKVEFKFFGLSIAMLSFINFMLIGLFIICIIYWQKKRWTR